MGHVNKVTLAQAFKEGAVRFLICTDVAARGLDISGLPYVVNVTLPDRAEDYIHRVGRVGRSSLVHMSSSAVPQLVCSLLVSVGLEQNQGWQSATVVFFTSVCITLDVVSQA